MFIPFGRGRDIGALLVLIPRQDSAGDRTFIGHIVLRLSAMANRSVRKLAGSSKTDKNDPFARDGDGKLDAVTIGSTL